MRIQELRILFIGMMCFLTLSSYGSTNSDPVDSINQKFVNWFHKDPETTKIYGIGTDKAYQEILKGKTSETVIVAVIDSGVDIEHEDLQANIWINEDEIAGNNLDDDNNGYIDDVHGWNFLGNASGENITHERLELTRNYDRLSEQFKGKKAADILPAEQKDYALFLKVEAEYTSEYEKAKEEQANINQFAEGFKAASGLIAQTLGKEDYSITELLAYEPENEQLTHAKKFLLSVDERGITQEKIADYQEYLDNKLNYHLNPDFDPRPLVGDDPENMDEYQYGNNDVEGEGAEHGTHVAGIIAGVRNNELGIEGIAENVKIMVLRAVPDGDERDKDIANAIEYAVNNGAKVINMSFGKSSSTHRATVEKAIKLCEEKGVLLVHAAGNDGENADEKMSFPTSIYLGTEERATTFINVGATSSELGDTFVATFSNYGRENVDIFAPGVDIYSLAPENEYEINSGTSMASPMVAGLAALLMSYYPSLDAEQVKEILFESASQYKRLKVHLPSSESQEDPEIIKFKKLSATGGVINAYEAVKMAEKISLKGN